MTDTYDGSRHPKKRFGSPRAPAYFLPIPDWQSWPEVSVPRPFSRIGPVRVHLPNAYGLTKSFEDDVLGHGLEQDFDQPGAAMGIWFAYYQLPNSKIITRSFALRSNEGPGYGQAAFSPAAAVLAEQEYRVESRSGEAWYVSASLLEWRSKQESVVQAYITLGPGLALQASVSGEGADSEGEAIAILSSVSLERSSAAV